MTDLAQSLARLTGEQNALIQAKGEVDALANRLAVLQQTNAAAKAEVVAQLQGVAGYRAVSTVDDFSLAERNAGQIAVVGAIKAGKDLSEDEAKACWREAALASRPTDRQWLLCDPDGLIQEYAANLGLTGWDEFKAWIVRTPVEEMGL